MKKQIFAAVATLICANAALIASTPEVAIVDFKQCAEESKLGKQQQENFEGLKQQIQDVMEEKEKAIKELSEKFQDPDFLDSLSPEAEANLKQEFQKSNFEYNQMQQQFFQTLQQANVQIVRLIGESVQEHAKQLAAKRNIDIVLNAENCFYFDSAYALTNDVIVAMDTTYVEQESATAEAETSEEATEASAE